ncbi:MAG: elongation factor P maturation arginine rhamnosyltransferase EarP [Zoogloeaceae bacterium]|nr:elongation factor P maturation arginine rhamnosyltransferase EarP [Zoogloeaceae bacterium]
MSSASSKTWDIFCRVVDNFGDIGVCWRLARQLASEHGLAVRLWVDVPQALRVMRGQEQPLGWEPSNLKVLRWESSEAIASLGEVVMEAFGGGLPEWAVDKLAHQNKASLWINLEYLSAESWVASCHGLPSPHPAINLKRYFFFPGFGAGTGGLLREGTLAEQRAEFADGGGAQALWTSLGGQDPWREAFNISLFSYEVRNLSGWLDVLAQGDRPTRLLIPVGRVLPQIRDWVGAGDLQPGDAIQRGRLICRVLPFLPQPDYDRLLWACDFNVVRGEDSFVRAQWALKPFLWHIYPQADDAHWIKLEAFLGRYLAGAPEALAKAVRALSEAWNGRRPIGPAWSAVQVQLSHWSRHAVSWGGELAGHDDLATSLVKFVNKVL